MDNVALLPAPMQRGFRNTAQPRCYWVVMSRSHSLQTPLLVDMQQGGTLVATVAPPVLGTHTQIW